MASEPPQFLTLMDSFGQPYLAANVNAIRNVSLVTSVRREDLDLIPPTVGPNTVDACTFLDEKLFISRRTSSIFSTDLTSRDDIILACLSIALILIIEAILTTFLLRTQHGGASNIGFSIKQYVDLAREFHLRHLIKSPSGPVEYPSKSVNVKLLVFATLILGVTFGIETAVLFLSSPHLRDITNQIATFSMIPVLNPRWELVWREARATLDRPCRDIVFENVEMGTTVMVPCVTFDVATSFEQFEPVNDTVSVTIISDLHEFGLEHTVIIGNMSATYSVRCSITAPGATTLLRYREQYFNRGVQFEFLHKQLVAYLFNAYVNKTGDTHMNKERLDAIDFHFTEKTGPLVYVVTLNGDQVGRSRMALTTRHQTTFKAIIPAGLPALRFAAVVFRASHGITTSGPDLLVLDLSSGSTVELEQLLWQEEARSLNWMVMLLCVSVSLALLAILRFLLKPLGTVEIVTTHLRTCREEREKLSFLREEYYLYEDERKLEPKYLKEV